MTGCVSRCISFDLKIVWSRSRPFRSAAVLTLSSQGVSSLTESGFWQWSFRIFSSILFFWRLLANHIFLSFSTTDLSCPLGLVASLEIWGSRCLAFIVVCASHRLLREHERLPLCSFLGLQSCRFHSCCAADPPPTGRSPETINPPSNYDALYWRPAIRPPDQRYLQLNN